MEKQGEYVPEATFTSLVIMLSSSAWVSLGKIADPLSGETKKDLEGSRYTIDTLVMLRDKTRGNLGEDENKLLNQIISELQANFAESFFSDEEKKEDGKTSDKDGAVTSSEKDKPQETT